MTLPFSFGTAGIRARAGAADDELNTRTVDAIGGAVFEYLASAFPGARARGICVGFDGRRDSRAFAGVLIARARSAGFRVRAFTSEVPTPLLAFATRVHDAVAGVMVTASHNPPADNGIKLYLEGGAQIFAPHDAAIEARLRAHPSAARSTGQEGPLETLGEAEVTRYVAALTAFVPSDARPLPTLAYSATCGVGTPLTRAVLAAAHASAHEVAAQAHPRADFGGLTSPNPEHEEALGALRTLADEVNAEVAFAHDPDADRLALLARDEHGVLRRLSGDEVGALLGAFLLAREPDPARALVATTHVSGDLLARVAAAQGATCLRTNTGFKWITSQAHASARALGLRYLFGYEEAIGYAFPALGDDKDGVAALYVVLALLRAARARGNTLVDELHTLFRAHGVHATRPISLTLRGADADARRGALVDAFAAADAGALLGRPGVLRDHRVAADPATLLELVADDGTRICVRPSGTEPKLKLYLHARAQVAEGGVVDADARCQATLDALEQRTRALLA